MINSKKAMWILSVLTAAVLSGCSGAVNSGSPTITGSAPTASNETNGVIHGSALFDTTISQSAQSSLMHRIKDMFALVSGKAYADIANNCNGAGLCLDWVDISVTNSANTHFLIDNDKQTITGTQAGSMVTFAALQIKDLYDNNLNICGAGQNQGGSTTPAPAVSPTPGSDPCVSGSIRIYTDNQLADPADAALVAGSEGAIDSAVGAQGAGYGEGLWNNADSTGVPLVVSSSVLAAAGQVSIPAGLDYAANSLAQANSDMGASPTIAMVQDYVDSSVAAGGSNPSDIADVLEVATITPELNLLQKENFPVGDDGMGAQQTTEPYTYGESTGNPGAGYALSADFTDAGSGNYKSHIVVDYYLQ